jgi:hypothetical protein
LKPSPDPDVWKVEEMEADRTDFKSIVPFEQRGAGASERFVVWSLVVVEFVDWFCCSPPLDLFLHILTLN